MKDYDKRIPLGPRSRKGHIIAASCLICGERVGEPSLVSSQYFGGYVDRGVICETASPRGRDSVYFALCDKCFKRKHKSLFKFSGGDAQPIVRNHPHQLGTYPWRMPGWRENDAG